MGRSTSLFALRGVLSLPLPPCVVPARMGLTKSAVQRCAFLPPNRTRCIQPAWGSLGPGIEPYAFPKPQGGQIGALVAVSRNPGRPVILFSHDRSVDLRTMVPVLKSLRAALGATIVAYDYSGYGWSRWGDEDLCLSISSSLAAARRPSEASAREDVSTALEFALRTLRRVNGSVLVAMGHGLGSGPTCWLAAHDVKHSIHAVVLLAPFRSVLEVSMSSAASQIMAGSNIFNNAAVAGRIACPVLVMHGTDDRAVNPSHSSVLAADMVAGRPTGSGIPVPVLRFISRCDHDGIVLHPDALRETALFLVRLQEEVRSRPKGSTTRSTGTQTDAQQPPRPTPGPAPRPTPHPVPRPIPPSCPCAVHPVTEHGCGCICTRMRRMPGMFWVPGKKQ